MKRHGFKVMILLMSFILLGCSREVYTVSFNSMGGTLVDDVMADQDSTISMPDSSKEGYSLDGWFRSLDEGETYSDQWVFTEDTVEDKMTLYAKWSLVTYTITFNTNGGTPVETENVAYNEMVEQPENPTREGYRFIGWYKGLLGVTLYDFNEAIDQDMTLKAKWEKESLDHVDIGVILPDASEERWTTLDGRFFLEQLEALGPDIKFDILFSEGDEEEEIANAEALIDRGAEVIILTSVGSGAAVANLVSAIDGVTLIAYERMASSDSASADYYTTFNLWDVGKAQGQHLVDMADENGCSVNDPCDLVLFSGRTYDWPAATYFFGGAMEAIIPELDMFNIINLNKEPFEDLAAYLDSNGVITEANFDNEAKDLLEDAMAEIDTGWRTDTAQYIASDVIDQLDSSLMSDDLYILCPADFLSPSIQNEFWSMDTPYNRLYVTGQDAMDIAIASLMGDTIKGEGTQTMTVFKDLSKLVASSLQLAQNIINGVAWDTDVESGASIWGVTTIYAPIDILLASDPEKTYDLIFASGYKDKDKPIFSDIDFSVYEDDK